MSDTSNQEAFSRESKLSLCPKMSDVKKRCSGPGNLINFEASSQSQGPASFNFIINDNELSNHGLIITEAGGKYFCNT